MKKLALSTLAAAFLGSIALTSAASALTVPVGQAPVLKSSDDGVVQAKMSKKKMMMMKKKKMM